MKADSTTLQNFSVDLIVRLMPFLYGVLWGCFAAVFFNAADSSSDTLRAFVAVLTALTGAGLGLWGSRSLSERNAERERKQRMLTDILAVEGLHHAVTVWRELLAEIDSGAGSTDLEKVEAADEETLATAGTALLALIIEYEEVPKFAEAIDSLEDRENILAIKSCYGWLERCFRAYKTADETVGERNKIIASCLRPSVRRSIAALEDILVEGAQALRAKLK